MAFIGIESRLYYYFTPHQNVHAEKQSENLPVGNTAPF